MNACVMLANFAKASDNMLDVQQAGWSFAGPGPVSFFVAGLVYCEWHETNQKHELKIELLDADGSAVQHPENENPVMVAANFEVGRPPGIKAGATMTVPFAVPFGAFELSPGEQYEIKLSIDGDARDEWRLPFTIRQVVPQQRAA
jgi:hypothetical protein